MITCLHLEKVLTFVVYLSDSPGSLKTWFTFLGANKQWSAVNTCVRVTRIPLQLHIKGSVLSLTSVLNDIQLDYIQDCNFKAISIWMSFIKSINSGGRPMPWRNVKNTTYCCYCNLLSRLQFWLKLHMIPLPRRHPSASNNSNHFSVKGMWNIK